MSSQPVEDAAPVSRVQRKRGRRVQEILSTAAELFGERGYDAVSLDDVAERLDVTKGSLYYYFPGKDELAVAAIETLGADWTGRLERLGGHDARPQQLAEHHRLPGADARTARGAQRPALRRTLAGGNRLGVIASEAKQSSLDCRVAFGFSQ